MPVDQKRINGPEVSIPYSIYVDLSTKQSKKERDAVEREEGRANDRLRKMCKVTLARNDIKNLRLQF